VIKRPELTPLPLFLRSCASSISWVSQSKTKRATEIFNVFLGFHGRYLVDDIPLLISLIQLFLGALDCSISLPDTATHLLLSQGMQLYNHSE